MYVERQKIKHATHVCTRYTPLFVSSTFSERVLAVDPCDGLCRVPSDEQYLPTFFFFFSIIVEFFVINIILSFLVSPFHMHHTCWRKRVPFIHNGL